MLSCDFNCILHTHNRISIDMKKKVLKDMLGYKKSVRRDKHVCRPPCAKARKTHEAWSHGIWQDCYLEKSAIKAFIIRDRVGRNAFFCQTIKASL